MRKDNKKLAVDYFKSYLEEKLKPRFGADQIELNDRAAKREVKKLINAIRLNNDIQNSHATLKQIANVLGDMSDELKEYSLDKKLKDRFNNLEMPKEIEPLISTAKAAELLGVSRKTITNWITSDKLSKVNLNKDNDKKPVYKVKVEEIQEIIDGKR